MVELEVQFRSPVAQRSDASVTESLSLARLIDEGVMADKELD